MKSAHNYLKINEFEFESFVEILYEALKDLDTDEGIVHDIKGVINPLKKLIVYDSSIIG